jgi:eukaryotic-like serine/threonine-protein kinase
MNDPQHRNERWRRLFSAFHEVREAAEADRERLMQSVDPDLRDDVRQLLDADATTSSTLDHPPFFKDSLIDTVVDRYRIVRVLGEGGMGVVYEAEQTDPIRRRVALKVLREEMTSGPEQARFEAERQALGLMSHANIARVYDGGTAGEHAYFTMEYVEGAPITKYCDENGLGIRERVQLLALVCEAIQHAHQRGVIHRDLKPSNVLVTVEDGRAVPKVIDFGIAKGVGVRLAARSVRTVAGTILGTPEYMSPEQASLEGVVDTRSDVYALGLLLYELLSGVLPFEFKPGDLLSTLMRISHDEPLPPAERLARDTERSADIARARGTSADALVRELRGELQWVVMKAIEKHPDRRYASAGDFGAELRRFLAHEPLMAGPPSGAYRLRKLVRRHRAVAIGVAAVVGTLLLGLAGTGWMALVASRERDAAQSARDNARRDADVARATTRFVQQMLSAPDPWAVERLSAVAREVKVVDVLDQARTQLDDLRDQPEVRASLAHTLGQTYYKLGLMEQARSLFDRAIGEHRVVLGAEHPDTLAAEFNLATLLDRKGDYAAARRLTATVLEKRRRVLGREHELTLATENLLGRIALREGKPKEAEPLLRRTLAAQRRTIGPDHATTLATANDLAEVLKLNGKRDEAETLVRDVLDRRRKTLGPDHPDTINSANNLAAALVGKGAIDEALLLFRGVVDAYSRALGPDQSRTNTARNNLAVALYRAKRFADAEREFRVVIEAHNRTTGPEHHYTLNARNNLARVLIDSGRSAEAEAMFVALLPVARRVLPPDHWDLATYRMGYGMSLAAQGRRAAGERLIADAHQALLAKLGPDDPRTKSAAARLAALRKTSG